MERLGGLFSSGESQTSKKSDESRKHLVPNVTPLSSHSSLLKEINDDFLNVLHEQADTFCDVEMQYTIIYQGGCLSLWQHHGRQPQLIDRVTIPNHLYDNTKSLAHIPTLLYLLMQSDRRENLESTRKKLDILIDQLIGDTILKDYVPFLGHCISIIDEYLQNPANVAGLVAQLKISTNQNVANLMKIATDQTLATLEKTLKNWMNTIPLDLEHTQTVIACTHGPRSRLIELQYILSLYKHILRKEYDSEILDNYVFITEVLASQLGQGEELEMQLLNEFLKPSKLNRKIGEVMLDNPLGMFQDILSEHGEQWVAQTEREQQLLAQCPYQKEKKLHKAI